MSAPVPMIVPLRLHYFVSDGGSRKIVSLSYFAVSSFRVISFEVRLRDNIITEATLWCVVNSSFILRKIFPKVIFETSIIIIYQYHCTILRNDDV